MSEEGETRTRTLLNEIKDMPPELDKLLEGVPNEQQHEIKRMFMASSMVLRRVAPEAPIMEKLTGEHLTEIIRNAESESKREHRSAFENKIFILLVTVIGLVFFGFIIV